MILEQAKQIWKVAVALLRDFREPSGCEFHARALPIGVVPQDLRGLRDGLHPISKSEPAHTRLPGHGKERRGCSRYWPAPTTVHGPWRAPRSPGPGGERTRRRREFHDPYIKSACYLRQLLLFRLFAPKF